MEFGGGQARWGSRCLECRRLASVVVGGILAFTACSGTPDSNSRVVPDGDGSPGTVDIEVRQDVSAEDEPAATSELRAPSPRVVLVTQPESIATDSSSSSPSSLPRSDAASSSAPAANPAAPNSAPVAPSPCDVSTLRADLGRDASFIDGLCRDGWAYVDTCVGACGDSQYIARYRGGWSLEIGFPSPLCRSDVRARGVPYEIVDRINWVCDGGSSGGDGSYGPEPSRGALSAGDHGRRVEGLQWALVTVGHLAATDVDSYFGPDTKSAVEAFQRASGLGVDGIAGPNTLGALGLSGG